MDAYRSHKSCLVYFEPSTPTYFFSISLHSKPLFEARRPRLRQSQKHRKEEKHHRDWLIGPEAFVRCSLFSVIGQSEANITPPPAHLCQKKQPLLVRQHFLLEHHRHELGNVLSKPLVSAELFVLGACIASHCTASHKIRWKRRQQQRQRK